MSNWYKREKLDDVYYTNESKCIFEYQIVGPGDRNPTPKEIYDALTSNPEWEYSNNDKLLYKEEKSEVKEKNVELPSDNYIYLPDHYPLPERLIPLKLRSDKHIRVPQFFDRIENEIKSWLNGREVYDKLKIQYRQGMLLYGEPGQGKTTLIRNILKNVFSKDSIIIFADKLPSHNFLENLKKDKRLKVFIFEELVTIVSENRHLDRMLNFLDGELSLNNSYIIATTNYPHKLPGNLVDRPSRFDKVIKIDNLNKESREIILKYYLNDKFNEEFIELTKDLSLAAIKEACIVSQLRDISLESAIKVLKDHQRLVKNDFAEIKTMGIHSFDDDD